MLYIGGPASGKTSVYGRLGPAPEAGYICVNVDEVRQRLPEYQQMVEAGDLDAALVTHDEASDVAKRCIDLALFLGRNLVVDAVGKDDRGQLSAMLRALLDHGYSIMVRCVTVPVAIAEKREKERAVSTGRTVPLDELVKGHQEVSRAFQSIIEFTGVRIELYDTSGTEPRLIAERSNKDLVVVDSEIYDEFVKKGED